MKSLIITFLTFCICFIVGQAYYEIQCQEKFTRINIEVIIDYAKSRNLRSLVLINQDIAKCRTKSIQVIWELFSKHNLFVSFRNNILLKFKTEGRIGVVLFAETRTPSNDSILPDDVLGLDLIHANSAWLIIAGNESKVLHLLKFATLDLRTDLVIALPTSFTRMEDNEAAFTDYSVGKCVKLNRTLNASMDYDDVNSSTDNEEIKEIDEENLRQQYVGYRLLQVYKIRKESNLSLVVHPLGLWTYRDHTRCFSKFKHIEDRLNFQQFPLKIGKKNTTQTIIDPFDSDADDDEDDVNLNEILEYLVSFLNASYNVQHFSKLGYKSPDGTWTDLLGAVVNEDIDLALHGVNKSPERFSDMVFTHTIIKSMRNIYIKPQQSTKLRNIFHIPFGIRLILGVIFTGLLLSLAMSLVTRMSEHEVIGWGDASIWCIGIFSMQGSPWTPRTCSGNIVLLITLLFALIIFNSYSAFITSILSVELLNIRSVKDLLTSDYSIGYAKNSQDEIYLRSMNDTELQQIYLRGYLNNPVTNISDGLMRSSKGHYGFFASYNVARRELRNYYRCNYDITEIPVASTVNHVAFPIPRNSPYIKIINLSILRMYETGVYKYVHSLIIPDLAKCVKKRIFRSAQLTDLMFAFAVLITGIIMSIFLIISEYLWKTKQGLYTRIRSKFFLKSTYLP